MSQTEVQLIKNGAVVDADINGMSSSKLSGALPAISGAALTNLPAGAGKAKNLIINGDMQIAQRNTSDQVSSSNFGYKTLDRWRYVKHGSPTAVYNMSKDTDHPDGFSASLKLATATADPAMAAGDVTYIDYQIESQDLQQLAYGTSSAKSLTLSFHVKSTVTGTYVIWIYSEDLAKALRKTYTISAQNTWEKKTVTIAGDTATALGNDVEQGLMLRWILSAGTDYTSGTAYTTWNTLGVSPIANRYVGQTANVAATTSDNWAIAGVQLELGDEATDFEYRSVPEQLFLCQRYFKKHGYTMYGGRYSTSSGFVTYQHIPEMRAIPAFNWTGRATTSGWDYGSYSDNINFQVLMTAQSPYIQGGTWDAEL